MNILKYNRERRAAEAALRAQSACLTAHKNTAERRHRKAMRAAMTKAAKDMGQRDIVAYAFVAIRSDGEALASWDTGAALPLWAFAPTIAEVLRKDIEDSGVEEDWRPSLTERRLHKG